VDTPTTDAALVEIVQEARRRGQTVKVVGAGHSFTDIACTTGRLVRLDGYGRVLEVDRERCLVTVEAGIRLRDLNERLAAEGLALANLGDIDVQTVAGAISTGTHGTGAALGNLATQVAGLELVTADGSVVTCSSGEEPDVFAAARVSLGALGVVSKVTLQCVPAFTLAGLEEKGDFDEMLDHLDARADANDHFEFFWFPHTEACIVKTNNRTDQPARPLSRWKRFRYEIWASNIAFDRRCRKGRRRPEHIPALARDLAGRLGRVRRVDRSDRIFCTPRLVRFNEMEYAIPREAAATALRELRDVIDERGFLVNFPVEVRWVAGDDIPLSPASGRPSVYVAVHLYKGMDFEPYFRSVEEIMRRHDGRPHWGKLHWRASADLAPAYPRWDEFKAVRARLDPEGRFANAYTDRVLGPPL